MVITEEIAEKLTPEKTPANADARIVLLLKIAKLAKTQGSFQLACKKYTQAGAKVKAMKALLNTGDTEKIRFFAGGGQEGGKLAKHTITEEIS